MDFVAVKNFLIEVGLRVNRRCVKKLCEEGGNLNREVKQSPADIIYQIDLEAEEEILVLMKSSAEQFGGIELIAEGIGENDISFYPDSSGQCRLKIICDPIDGSRGLMYGKRSAFFLAAAGEISAQCLRDLKVSVMVELPIPKQGKFDVLSAVKGSGFEVYRFSMNGDKTSVKLSPSREKSIENGFVSFAKFCYPGKDLISLIEERFLDKIFKGRKAEHLPVFDDQYISTGGQLYELICGHDRFIVDFRASLYRKIVADGGRTGQICHPYDMAGWLVAEEAGIILHDINGNLFNAPLYTTHKLDWVGYANKDIQKQCQGPFLDTIEEFLLR